MEMFKIISDEKNQNKASFTKFGEGTLNFYSEEVNELICIYLINSFN